MAVGQRTGQKVFTLQTVPAQPDEEQRKGVAQYAGFSLHAAIGIEPEQRAKLERLARYVSRPAVSVERLTLTAQGAIRYRLKTPYRDGTTDILLEPLDFLARLAALVPPPRIHLTRYHGVFAPHAALRAAITPAGRGQGGRNREAAVERPLSRHVAMSLSAQTQTRLRHRHRAVPAVRRAARGDREHRRAGADRAHPRAP